MNGFGSALRLSAMAAAALLLASCGKAPKGQTVAIVDDQEITIQDLGAELQDTPVPDNVDRKALSKLILEGLIDRKLQVAEARKQGLDKTERYLGLKNRNEEELLATMLGHKVAQTVPLPVDREIQNYIYNNPLQFGKRQQLVLDQLTFPAPRDRSRLTAALANVHSMDAAAAALQSIGIAAARGQGAIDTGQTEPDVARQILAAPAGEPILLPRGDQLIIGVITASNPVPMRKEVANLAAARAVRGATLLRESQAQIAAARDKAKITYAPGFEPDTPAK